MKSTSKNSQNNKDTWIYILLLLMLVVSVGTIAYYFINKPKADLERKLANINDVSKVERNIDYTDTHIIQKAITNWRKKAKCGKKIIENSKLTLREKEAFENLLKGILAPKLEPNELLAITDLAEKTKIVNQILDEESKLGKLENEVDPEKFQRASKLWREEQPTWLATTFLQEGEAARAKIDKLFKPFYQKFLNQILSEGEEKRALWIKPTMVKGELTTEDNLQQHIDYLKTQQFERIDQETGQTIILPTPLKLNFLGFTDYLDKSKEKDEEKTLLGETDMGKISVSMTSSEKGREVEFKCNAPNCEVRIELKKELVFSRKGEDYDEWITTEPKEKGGYNLADISWDTLIETIAHELAHAVINALRWEYEEENGGHGLLHNDYTTRIRKMIEKSLEYEEFKQWWQEKW